VRAAEPTLSLEAAQPGGSILFTLPKLEELDRDGAIREARSRSSTSRPRSTTRPSRAASSKGTLKFAKIVAAHENYSFAVMVFAAVRLVFERSRRCSRWRR
jgi:hypothetical protein